MISIKINMLLPMAIFLVKAKVKYLNPFTIRPNIKRLLMIRRITFP